MKLTRRFLAPVSFAAALAAVLLSAGAGFPPWARASHATFVVNNSGDDHDASPGDGTCAKSGGGCTLRAAIEEANAHAGADAIHFAIKFISVDSAGNGELPHVTDQVTIDGTAFSSGRAELDGINLTYGEGLTGLYINAPNSIVSGMVLNRFAEAGVFFGANSDGSTLRNSFIGTDVSGTVDRGNGDICCSDEFGGVRIWGSGITIGGTSAGDGNVISGNRAGVVLASSASNTTIAGNYIGTDANGTADLGNSFDGIRLLGADDTVIGGVSAGARNIISGNGTGIRVNQALSGAFSQRTTIAGNYIGTDVNGTADLGNDGSGVSIQGADETTIGGSSAGARNVISGNGNSGIYLDQSADYMSETATIAGNYIGTSVSGNSAISNGGEGVYLDSVNDACVGGIIVSLVCTPTSGAGNVISGNIGTGIKVDPLGGGGSGHVIIGNYIGINAAGTAALANSGNGIDATFIGATIGGTSALARNVISGNGLNGVRMDRTTGGASSIQGNYIGLNAAGTQAIGNLQDGIHIERAPNCIGGQWNGSACNPVAGGGNVISGNLSDGIEFAPAANDSWVQSNLIGINAAQTVGLGNAGHGVYINGAIDNRIGGTTGGNTIFANGLDGVRVSGAAAGGNSIRGNSIWANGGKGIENINGGNGEPGHAPPLITAGDFSGASGTTCPGCTIDVYSDNTEDEGRVYHGTAVADGAGNWSFTGTITGPKLTATATNAAGSTTEFSSFAGNPQVGPEFFVNSIGPENDGICSDAFGDCTIREAINAANADGMGSVVQLGNAQTYTLTGVDNAGNGLPVISTEIGIFGHGSTIARDPGAPLFRIFQVPTGGNLLLDNVTVSGGEATGATGDGGGIFVNGGQLITFNSRVTGNRAAMGTTGTNGGPGRHGGGIAISNGGSAQIWDSTINGNIAGTGGLGTELNGGNGGNGGGIALLGGTLNMERSLVSVNFAGGGRFAGADGSGGAGGWGGGLYLGGGSGATISNTTIHANSAGGGAVGTTGNGNGGSGGGIAAPSVITTLTNLTLSNNNVGAAGGANAANGTGSGIYGDGAGITIRNTIMANGPGGNCSSVPQLGSAANISTDATCGASFTQRTLAQINFGTFGNNGGPTSTLPLVPPSAAIDAGDNNICSNPPVNWVDQRGVIRPHDGDANGSAICDVGAFEYCADADSDARCDPADNCPAVANWGQEDFDADGQGDACDIEDDGDGFTDEAESGTPLCGNAVNDDSPDDGVANDGCPGGPPQAGAYSEAQFSIGTDPGYPCGGNSWPADLRSGGIPDSTNRINVLDLTSFLAPTWRLNTSPGDSGFSSRWDLVPGRGVFSKFINVQDLTTLITLTPPMLNGARAWNGPVCPYPSQ